MKSRDAKTPTPGPWVIMQDAMGWHVADEQCIPVAMIALQQHKTRELANARIIAAAHDMADALQTAQCALQQEDNTVLIAMALNKIQIALIKGGF